MDNPGILFRFGQSNYVFWKHDMSVYMVFGKNMYHVSLIRVIKTALPRSLCLYDILGGPGYFQLCSCTVYNLTKSIRRGRTSGCNYSHGASWEFPKVRGRNINSKQQGPYYEVIHKKDSQLTKVHSWKYPVPPSYWSSIFEVCRGRLRSC